MGSYHPSPLSVLGSVLPEDRASAGRGQNLWGCGGGPTVGWRGCVRNVGEMEGTRWVCRNREYGKELAKDDLQWHVSL